MNDAAPLKILEDTRLLGAAEFLADLGEDDDAAARVINERLREQGIAVPGARFGMDDLRRLVNRLRGRIPVEDLGVHEAKVDWLRFHVPPSGSARLQLYQEGAQTGSVRLKFMGLGYGSGHSIKLSVSQDLGDRAECFAIGVRLLVRLRTYRESDQEHESLQVDVNQVLGSYVVTRPPPCGRCFTAPEPGYLPRRLEREWDFKDDPHGLTETVTYELGDSGELEIGLDLPVPGLGTLTPGLAMTRNVTSRTEAVYTFPGGARFSSYSEITPSVDVPFWGRS